MSGLVSDGVVYLSSSFFELLFDEVTVWVRELIQSVHVLILFVLVQVFKQFTLS